jgi:hypothetical protein
MNYIKYYYSQFKDNLNILILVPTILGGIWQLLELSSISTSFIRFFSLSQLVADGILILFILAILVSSFKLSKKIILGKNNFSFNLDKDPLPKWHGLLLMAITGFAFFFTMLSPIKNIYLTRNITIAEIAILIPGSMMTIGGFALGFISLGKNIIYYNASSVWQWLKKIQTKKRLLNNITYFLSLSIIILSSLVLKFILVNLNPHISNFRQYILFPKNLLNQELLNQNVINQYHLKYKPVLIYNNDKYFFYEIKDDKEQKKILIIDYNKLIEITSVDTTR